MKVAMMAYTESGGAGRAALRLMDGLNQIQDVDCKMIVQFKNTRHENVISIKKTNPFFRYIQSSKFAQNVATGHTMMSMMYSGTEKEYLELVDSYDIVHFHWISNFVSVESMKYLSESGKSLVWTFHDRNPMTGGCHCTYGCEEYISNCTSCPEMQDNPYYITEKVLYKKLKYIPKNLVVVTPSRWMADCAKKSRIFKNHRIEIIPNSIDLHIFNSLQRNDRTKLGIANDAKVILYCAEAHEQIHKGYRYFIEALQWIRNVLIPYRWEKIVLLLIGRTDDILQDTEELGVTVVSLGYVKDDNLLATAYTLADVTVLPSLEDNFPNVMLESISCGTPVAAFRTGGIPDVIQDGINGYVVPQKDSQALGNAIVKILEGKSMKQQCYSFAEKELSQELQAKRYRDLYDDILSRPSSRASDSHFALPLDTHQLLAPYYFEAMQHLLSLDEASKRRFLKGISLEDDILAYVMQHTDWIKDCPNDSIAIWGTGRFSKRLVQSLMKLDISFDKKLGGFFDANPQGSFFSGYPYLSHENILSGQIKTIVIGSVKFENEIYQEIRKYEMAGTRILRLRCGYENSIL